MLGRSFQSSVPLLWLQEELFAGFGKMPVLFTFLSIQYILLFLQWLPRILHGLILINCSYKPAYPLAYLVEIQDNEDTSFLTMMTIPL